MSIRIGVIGTTNSHACQYIGLLNGWRQDIPFPQRLPDGRPSGMMHQAFGTHLREASRLFPESLDFGGARVTRLWSESAEDAKLMELACDVEIVATPADAAQNVDAVMVLSEDPAQHLAHSEPSLTAGLPTFVDKPLAADEAEAEAIDSLARRHGVPWFTGSALRFDAALDGLAQLVEQSYGGVQSIYVQCPLRARLYASHAVEVVGKVMKSFHAVKVSGLSTANNDVVVIDFADGRSATLENNGAVERMSYVAVLQSRLREHIWTCEDVGLMNTRFLKAFLGFARSGVPPVSPEECLASFRLTKHVHQSLGQA
ncbi:hypothetical protein FPZ12_006760 [Amycolatopsis acidicola]|uniref:Gfo/Idh/MocA-like oxidoreductase N-terminal domain-containing protein n=1 Tax=Amycolatopsis acidicola TaxID=2596893 RepID=A0A5N0VF37_9PSEU|nr:Gfo/Idh/MocA family oxidoreductase [Amycolatopsis acidicola]KAA9164949.1 hypothetical protein FPZ12_006760 [Amycolatopsis acidicola]